MIIGLFWRKFVSFIVHYRLGKFSFNLYTFWTHLGCCVFFKFISFCFCFCDIVDLLKNEMRNNRWNQFVNQANKYVFLLQLASLHAKASFSSEYSDLSTWTHPFTSLNYCSIYFKSFKHACFEWTGRSSDILRFILEYRHQLLVLAWR